jgi:hypothetical protein
MPTIVEGNLTFTFSNGWNVSKYDDWAHYRKQFINVGKTVKAIDVLAIEPTVCCWLLEVKDYRQYARTKAINLADEIAQKVCDTLAGLVSAQFWANDATEKSTARQALRVQILKVVLHLEQPAKHSKLFPRAINPAVVQQQLKQLIKAIDPHPRVVEKAAMPGIPWQVT